MMAHKRDFYLILNQRDVVDCWIILSVFSSLYFSHVPDGMRENLISLIVSEISTWRSERIMQYLISWPTLFMFIWCSLWQDTAIKSHY